MIATIVGRVAVDAGSADSERHESVRQRRVVLTSRCWRQCTWRQQLSGRHGGKRAVLRGDHVISRKAIAQGMSDVLRCPVCSCAHFFYPLHMRPRVQRASGIPCALCFREGEEFPAKLAQCVRRDREGVFSVIPRCAIAYRRCATWRTPRNDDPGADYRPRAGNIPARQGLLNP
jgi:hypothetical protein